MFDDMVNLLDLGAFLDKDKKLFRTDFTYKKQLNQHIKEARQVAKRDDCYFCGKRVTSFCNSHSIPRFCLENIAINGDVLTLNAIVGNPLVDAEIGVNKAGTFRLICNECDSKIFADYENPDNYSNQPTPKMIAQMALKNSLKSISKRLVEIELFKIIGKETDVSRMFSLTKNIVNEMDLKEYEESYKKAKKALEKNSSSDYYVCYYEKLNYVVPVAFQGSLAL